MLIPLVGLLFEALLGRVTLRGYRVLAKEINALSKAIRGRPSRDGADITVAGTLGRRKVMIRISRSELKPELSLKVRVPVDFTLYCFPNKYPSEMGRVALRMAEPAFGSLFRVTTDHPKPAAFFLTYTDAAHEIRKLCNSAHTLLALRDGTLEFSEMTFPAEDIYRHVLGQLQLMVKIADAAARTSGKKSLPPEGQPRDWLRTGYVCASALLLTATLVAARSRHPNAETGNAALRPSPQPKDSSSLEMARIPAMQEWRLAQISDFDSRALAWMRDEGYSSAAGRVPFSATADGNSGIAYLLKPKNGISPTRLVITIKGAVKFDVKFPAVATMARVRHDAMNNVEWGGRPPLAQPEGDGVLVIWHINEPQSSSLFFASGSRIFSGDPKDYQSIALE